MKKFLSTTILFFFIFCSSNLFCDELIVRYPKPESPADLRYEYPLKLLEAALAATEESYGAYNIELVDHDANKSRLGLFLQNNRLIDIIWHAENGKLEEDFLPVRIPLLKGIIGFRIFLIRISDQMTFRSIDNLEDLRTLKGGFGHSWADRRILEYNELPLTFSSDYENLFKMLNRGRFDYFPRGINEAWHELDIRSNSYHDMMVEDSIILYYPMPIYFVVNKSNSILAERVEKGLRISIEDGTFEEVFQKYHSDILKRSNLTERKLILLDNPYLPDDTPGEKKFWLDLINSLSIH